MSVGTIREGGGRGNQGVIGHCFLGFAIDYRTFGSATALDCPGGLSRLGLLSVKPGCRANPQRWSAGVGRTPVREAALCLWTAASGSFEPSALRIAWPRLHGPSDAD